VFFCHSRNAWRNAVQVNRNHWWGYMTVIVTNRGNITYTSTLTAGICPMIKYDVDIRRDCFHKEVKWTLATHFQLATLCVGFGRRTPPSTRSATGRRYLQSATRESIHSKRSAADSKWWRSSSSSMLSLADWMKWDLTLLTCARTWYWLERVTSIQGRCFSIPLSRSPLCVPQMVWTKCHFAA